jgi:hypothetical protein
MFYEIELTMEERLIGLGIQDLIHDGVNVIPVDLKGGLVRDEVHKVVPVLVDIDDKAWHLSVICVILILILRHFER